MKNLIQKVDTRSHASMVEYLSNHFRYDTMSSWNCSTSYANNLKIHKVIPSEYQNKVFGMMDTPDFYTEINYLIEDWNNEQNYQYQAGFNGRSGGYLVLYVSDRDMNGKISCWPGRSIDQDVKFEYWDNYDLKNRVRLIQSFDKLCQNIINHTIWMAKNMEIEEQTYSVIKTRNVLVESTVNKNQND